MDQDPRRGDPALLESLLLRTSRTFALSIPELPEPTRHQVTVAYLLFRIADTLEDATRWAPARQVRELERLARILEDPRGPGADRAARGWVEDPPLVNPDYVELLARLPLVLEELERIAAPQRDLIRRQTLRTIGRMAGFVRRAAPPGGSLELRDVGELREYCYAVAGIVGEMLTELFLAGRPQLGGVATDLRRRAAAFGEALQLVNILKDSAFDAGEGRRYLPRDVERAEVFALARADLAEAQRYILQLQAAGAPRGLVAFTALPVLLARAALDRVATAGPGAKIARPQVLRIVRQLERALDRNQPAVPLAAAAPADPR